MFSSKCPTNIKSKSGVVSADGKSEDEELQSSLLLVPQGIAHWLYITRTENVVFRFTPSSI